MGGASGDAGVPEPRRFPARAGEFAVCPVEPVDPVPVSHVDFLPCLSYS